MVLYSVGSHTEHSLQPVDLHVVDDTQTPTELKSAFAFVNKLQQICFIRVVQADNISDIKSANKLILITIKCNITLVRYIESWQIKLSLKRFNEDSQALTSCTRSPI